MLPIDRLEKLKSRVSEIHMLLSDPSVSKDRNQIQSLGKELSKTEPTVKLFEKYQLLSKDLAEAEQQIKSAKDEETIKFYEEEKKVLSQKQQTLESEIESKLLGSDADSEVKSIIVEIRAGTGGEEASLFAKDLFRMYSRYCQEHGLTIEVMNTTVGGKGGFKEIIFSVSGEGAYSALKYESGIHRVQRVPETEASGRVHTSASTVAVLPEVDEVEIEIRPEDLRIEVCRAGGPGGQGVNTTDSAVQIWHLPTGLMVRCQDERSQLKNKAKGMRVLRARLHQLKQDEQNKQISEARKSQVGSGDRSGKIRTYNFPDSRVTDHRIGLTLHNLHDILNGHLDDLVIAMQQAEREEKLKSGGNS